MIRRAHEAGELQKHMYHLDEVARGDRKVGNQGPIHWEGVEDALQMEQDDKNVGREFEI
jgi:hypothetical protein